MIANWDPARASAQHGSILVAKHDFSPRSEDELSLKQGDKIKLEERDEDFNDGWFLGINLRTGIKGLFPEIYTTLAPRSTNASVANGPRRTSGSMPHAVQAHELPASSPQYRPVSATTIAGSQRPVSGSSSLSRVSNGVSRSSLPASTSDSQVLASTQSPVMHETLTVIDEHMNDMNPSASRHNPKRDTISSLYSSHPARMSYIAGHETEDEEGQLYTESEVLSWSPDRVAEYLEDHGVEKAHCNVFREQEINGEVLLAMDQSSVFLKEFDLGPVGRRLRTWNKIKALQNEIQRNTTAGAASTEQSAPSAVHELEAKDIGRARSTSAASALPRSAAPSRSMTASQPHSQPTSAVSPSMSRSNSSTSPLMQQTSSLARQDSTYRPSAQNIRTMQHWRHSSIDSTGTSLDSASVKTGHRKQSSTDQSGYAAKARANHAYNVSTETTPFQSREAIFASPTSTTPNDVDKGYFSSTEVDSRSKRNGVLQKKQNSMPPSSTSHSRNNSFLGYGRRNTTSTRVVSTDSLDKLPAASGAVSSSQQNNVSRTTSMPTYANKTMSTVNEFAPPVVTKLDHNSPSSTTTSPAPVTSANSSAANTPNHSSTLAFFSKTSKIPGMRAISDAVTRTEKTSANGAATPRKESDVSSPVKDGMSTPSTGAPSFDLKSGQRGSTGSASGIMPLPVPRKKRTSTKKTTSAYTRGLEKKTPAEQMVDCDYSGWMKKKSGSLMTTWKTRLFVLKGRRLSYYYSEDDVEEKGLIDISFHNVMPAMDEKLVSMHAAVTGVGASPVSPKDAATTTAAQQDLKDNPPQAGADDDGLFIFKLTPPKSGRGVNFTKPTVHYFAVNSRQEGRLWMAALMKAVIDRDQDGVVTTTYNQKTISLAKARARKERPPALKDEDTPNLDSDVEGLGIGGLKSNGTPGIGADNDRGYAMEDGSSVAASTVPTTTPSIMTDFDIDIEKDQLARILS